MTRLYSSFDLGKIVADEDARREEERKDADAAARRAAIDEKRAGRSKKASATAAIVSGPSAASHGRFSIEKSGIHYLLHNLVVNGAVHDYLWSSRLLPGDASDVGGMHEQDVWLTFDSYRTIGNITFDIPSAPEYAATIVALYRHRDIADVEQKRLLEKFRKALREDFKNYRMATSTRTTYTPSGDDVVEHCRKRAAGRYECRGPVAGASDWLDATMPLKAQTLLGIADVPEFLDAIFWLTYKKAHVFSCAKGKEAFERALLLGIPVGGATFIISAYGDDDNHRRPAHGVRVLLPGGAV